MTKQPCSYCGKHRHKSSDVICGDAKTLYPLPMSEAKYTPLDNIVNSLDEDLEKELSSLRDRVEYLEKTVIKDLEEKIQLLQVNERTLKNKLQVMKEASDKAGIYKTQAMGLRYSMREIKELSFKESKVYKLACKALA